MVKLSERIVKLLKDDVVSILYENAPVSLFTNEIAMELRRDNEFTKKLLEELKVKGLVEEVRKSNKGKEYIKRTKWRIPPKVMSAFENNF
jgi:predicted HTH transcriptional regulator